MLTSAESAENTAFRHFLSSKVYTQEPSASEKWQFSTEVPLPESKMALPVRRLEQDTKAVTALPPLPHLAFFMVNLSAILRQQSVIGDLSVRALKATFRARRYLSEKIKLLPHPPDDALVSRI
jgi:hypothetical protein